MARSNNLEVFATELRLMIFSMSFTPPGHEVYPTPPALLTALLGMGNDDIYQEAVAAHQLFLKSIFVFTNQSAPIFKQLSRKNMLSIRHFKIFVQPDETDQGRLEPSLRAHRATWINNFETITCEYRTRHYIFVTDINLLFLRTLSKASTSLRRIAVRAKVLKFWEDDPGDLSYHPTAVINKGLGVVGRLETIKTIARPVTHIDRENSYEDWFWEAEDGGPLNVKAWPLGK